MKRFAFHYRIAAFIALTLSAFALQLPFARAAGTVTTCDEASLDAALAGGGVITFACSGTITVTNPKRIFTSTTLDGAHNVILSGGGRVHIFDVQPTANFNILNLTLADGYSENGGGAINGMSLGWGTTTTVTDSTFINNRGSSAGAIVGEIVTVNNSTFTNNTGYSGGAIFGLTVNVNGSTFSNNQSTHVGGAIYATNVIVLNSTFSYNSTHGIGGALSASSGTVSNTLFTNNSALWDSGGAIYSFIFDTWNIVGSVFVNNSAYNGSAVYFELIPDTVVTISGSAFFNNSCYGVIVDGGGNLVNTAPGCPGEYSDSLYIDYGTPPPPPQCQEMDDPTFAAPVGTYCQTLMRDGTYVGYAGTIPGELVDAGVIIAMEVIYYDAPGHASQTFPEEGNQQVCLQGDGRFIYLDATQSPRQIVEMNSVYESGYTCAWIPHPGTVILIEG